MTSTTILTEDSAAIVSEDAKRFRWSVVLAGAVAAIAVTFFLITLGSGVGLALASPQGPGRGTLLTMGAIYFLVAQAFGFTVGGYLVGRLIGPEAENDKEEEFRAAAHGMAMWAVAVVAGLLLASFSSTLLGAAGAARPAAETSDYYIDMLFRPALGTPGVMADKEESGRILAMDLAGGGMEGDSARVADLVSHDTGLSSTAAIARVSNTETHMRLDADAARKAASIVSLWTAAALLFGAVLAVASAISARWMDDKVSFSWAPRRR